MSRTRAASETQPRLTLLACSYLALLMIFGGGGSSAPASEIVCQLLAVMTALIWLWTIPSAARRPVPKLVLVSGLIVALPAVQLIPLPPILWQALPDRSDFKDALALIGQDQTWRAWSIAPYRTFAALLSLAPPLLAMALTSQLDRAGRRSLLKTIAAIGLLSVGIGALQLAANGVSPLLFYGDDGGALYGFQANRNAQADVLLIALLALVAAWASGRGGGAGRDSWPGVAALALLLLLGVVMTTSRTGIVLIPLALIFAGWIALRTMPELRLSRRVWALWAAAIVAAVVLAWRSPAVARVMERFDFAGEYRVDIWRDTMFAIGQSWPVGTGMGTFQQAIFPAERLESVGQTLPNRAHNEVLELTLEAGLPGLVCWLLVAGIVGLAINRGLRNVHGSARLPIQFAAGTLSIAGLHAAVDYPFRSMALAGLIGVAAGIALATGAQRPFRHFQDEGGQD